MDDVRLEIPDYVVDAEAEGEGEAQRGVERKLHTAEDPKDVSSLLAESTSPGGPLTLPQIWTETGTCFVYVILKPRSHAVTAEHIGRNNLQGLRSKGCSGGVRLGEKEMHWTKVSNPTALTGEHSLLYSEERRLFRW
jgi:hypothetical protein